MKLVLALTGLVVVLGSLGSYVGGRILLPEVGLTAPSYGTWLAFTVVTLLFAAPIKGLEFLMTVARR